jgi:hypothetical protein
LPRTKTALKELPIIKNRRARSCNYFFLSSFFSDFGLHFSQTFLFLAASMQHLWVHSLPFFFASSQQEAFTVVEPIQAKVQTITVINLIVFMSFLRCGEKSPGKILTHLLIQTLHS